MGKLTLQGITWDHSRGFDPLVACSAAYLAEKGVNIQWQKRTLKDFGDQSLQDLARQYDLLIVDHPHSGVSAASECVIPLDEYIDKNALQKLAKQSAGPSFDSYFYKNHQWALPVDAAMQSAAYRPDLLHTPLPKTWQQVLQVDKLGMALCPTDSLCSFLSLSAQMGAPIREENSQLIPEEKGMAVLALMKEIHATAHPESANMNPIQLFDLMAQSDEISYAPMAFCYTNYSRAGYRSKRLNFTDSPRFSANNDVTDVSPFSTVLGGAGVAISSNCQHKQQAADFAKWICSDAVQSSIYTQEAGQPGNGLAWQDKSTNELTHQFFNSTLRTLESAYVRPRFAQWPEFQEYLGDVVHDYLVNGKSNVSVIRHLNQTYQNLDKS